MTTPETIAGALAKGGVERGLAAARTLLVKVGGPAADEVGLLLQDHVRIYRLRNQLRMLAKVQDLLHSAHVEPHPVPLRTLLPLLEGAALEDDEGLSDKWAGLLATAAAQDDPSGSHPSFARILGEISPREAHILDDVSRSESRLPWPQFRDSMSSAFACSSTAIDEAYGNLDRLGLCRIVSVQQGPGPIIEISPFGKNFLRAVEGPSRRRD